MTLAKQAQAAEQLHEARDHLRAVTDSMGEALCTLDDAGHVSYMNAAAERLLGWSIDELRGQTLHNATHYRHADGSPYPIGECPLYAGHRERKAVRVEDDMFVHRDGSDVPVTWVLSPFYSSSGANSVIVFTDNSQDKATQHALQLEIEQLSQIRELHEALREQRFELFAQPIVDLATGAVVSHELLLRMRERDGGVRTPGSFLLAAERCGLICEIDRWVIREAARIAGEGHRVELNLSAKSLSDPGLFEAFAEALADHDADPALMGIELTETALLHDEVIARTFIERIRALGCRLALDDFGTGFGAFIDVKRLPFDYLKIDIEFVRDLCTNSASRHVVDAVVRLAGAFGQRTVAEGVEDEETLAMVRSMGVDYAQGFGIGCPGPLADTLYVAPAWGAGERDQAGEQRDHEGVRRDHEGEQRDQAGVERDQAGDDRDEAGDERDHAGDLRDHAGGVRDDVADRRDHAADRRDDVAERRDDVANRRDHAGDQRDHAADQRDEAAKRTEAGMSGQSRADVLGRSALARRQAADDRMRSSQDRRAGAIERDDAELDRGTALADRRAGASERTHAGSDRDTALADRGAGAGERIHAEHDRNTALADRGAGASERTEAELDRSTALSDRGASAREREHSSVDGLTGAYLRDAGLVELEREMATAWRTTRPLVLAFVDVDGLKAVNDAGGHAAGDRMLVQVADAFRAKLRSQDLIIRVGGDEFVCVISGLDIAGATKRIAGVEAALAMAPGRGSVTVGLASLQPEDTLRDFLARADGALYRERERRRSARA